jgi:hypothetical protein
LPELQQLLPSPWKGSRSPRSICNGWFRFIPYASFSFHSPAKGRLLSDSCFLVRTAHSKLQWSNVSFASII